MNASNEGTLYALPEELIMLVLRKLFASSGSDFANVILVSKRLKELAHRTPDVCFQLTGKTRSIKNKRALSFGNFLETHKNIHRLTLKDIGLYQPIINPQIEKLSSLTYLKVTRLSAGAQAQLPKLAGLHNLAHLHLAENHCGHGAFQDLGGLSQLTCLEVRGNTFGGDALGNLCQALGNLTSLVQLHLSHNSCWMPFHIEKLTSLTSLDLSGNNLRGNESVLGQAALGQLQALTTLDLSDNPIGFNGAQSLASVLEKLTALSSLKLNPSTMYNVGLYHHHGHGAKDQERAVEWFKKAAEVGQSDAQNHLGWCYRNGSGVEWDHELAVKWFKKAAHQGDTDAHCNLGLCYFEDANKFGEEEDLVRSVECFRKAVECFRKAADQNHALAEYEMGLCYTSGLGVEEDYLCAANWYKRAVDHGNRDAIYSLGICYKRGRGVEKDKERAIELFRVAAAQGCSFSRRRLQQEA